MMNRKLQIIKALYLTYRDAYEELKPYFGTAYKEAIKNYLLLFYIAAGISGKPLKKFEHWEDGEKMEELGKEIKSIIDFTASKETIYKIYRNVIVGF